MVTNSKAKKIPQNTICLRKKRLERSKLALSKHSVEPTILENSQCDRKEKLTSLVGKIRYAQNRTHRKAGTSEETMTHDDKFIWEID